MKSEQYKRLVKGEGTVTCSVHSDCETPAFDAWVSEQVTNREEALAKAMCGEALAEGGWKGKPLTALIRSLKKDASVGEAPLKKAEPRPRDLEREQRVIRYYEIVGVLQEFCQPVSRADYSEAATRLEAFLEDIDSSTLEAARQDFYTVVRVNGLADLANMLPKYEEALTALDRKKTGESKSPRAPRPHGKKARKTAAREGAEGQLLH